MTQPAAGGPPARLDCLAILGLRLPVSEADVKQAYLEKVKTAHPDHGGDPKEFLKVQEAFEQATQYARFKASRMQWLGQWVEQYAAQQELIKEIQALGGVVEAESIDWLSQLIGPDFATVLDRISRLRLSGQSIDDAIVNRLAEQRQALAGLKRLELIDTRITSQGLLMFKSCQNLELIDLSGTQVDSGALEKLLSGLVRLRKLVLKDTGIGWLARQKIHLAHRGLSVSA